jgi:hypothetical protein
MVPLTECKAWIRYDMITILGESTSPQGVNGLIILDPYLLDPWRWFAGHVHVGHSS